MHAQCREALTQSHAVAVAWSRGRMHVQCSETSARGDMSCGGGVLCEGSTKLQVPVFHGPQHTGPDRLAWPSMFVNDAWEFSVFREAAAFT
jgi:hypothetical protein